MPDPRPSETWREFERRCIPAVIREGRKAGQAWQICRSIYRQRTTPSAQAQAREAKPLRKGIPSKVWRGFDRAVSKAHGPIRGAFRRSTDELRSAFTLDEARDALTLFGDLEPLISGPEAVLPWRAASEELYDLFLGPRDMLDQDAGAEWLPGGPPAPASGVEPVNADRSRPQDAPIARAMTDAGAVAASTTEPLRLDWWDRETMRLEMVAWARDNAAARVTAIDDATRGGIREIVTQAFDPEVGIDRDGIARALRALDGSDGRLRLGLDAPRQRSLMKYIDGLPAKLPAGRRQKLVDRRFSQLLKARTNTIARTEALTVGNEGQLITWQKAVRDGSLDAGEFILEYVAITTACPICAPFDGSTREIESGVFTSTDGRTIALPDPHPRGRCTVRTIRRADALRPPTPIEAPAPTLKTPAPPRFSSPEDGKAWLKQHYVDFPRLFGASTEAYQDIADAMHEVFGDTGNRISVLLEQQGGRVSGRHILDLNTGKSRMLIRSDWLKDYRKVAAEMANNHRLRRDELLLDLDRKIRAEADPSMLAKLKSKQELLEAAQKWGVSHHADRPLYSLVAHEAAHEVYYKGSVLYKGVRVDLKQAWELTIRNLDEVIDGAPKEVLYNRVSEYGAVNPAELFAEIRAELANDPTGWEIPAALRKPFQELMHTYEGPN